MTATRRASILVFLVLILAFCAHAQVVHFTILQINDLYEITPIAGGKEGGMARLATLRGNLLKQNPHTYTILAGDALSPSVLGTAIVDGNPLAGQQMVSMLNAVGVDFATFGNHEFDLTQEQFHARIRESRFPWFSGNVHQANGEPFPGVRQNVVFTIPGDGGETVRVGLIGVTLNQNKKPWVQYADVLQTAREQVTNLKAQGVNVIIAVTHETFADDGMLAEKVPGIDLILGGHEHENVKAFRGSQFIPIAKADANLRSAYIHDLSYDTRNRTLQVESRLAPITDRIPENPVVAELAKEWTEKGFAAFRKAGFEPTQVVAVSPEVLEGKESAVRSRPTNLTNLIAQAFLHSFPNAEVAIFNSGSIRIDDNLMPGPITQYDVLRVLPFGGKVTLAEMKGSLVARVLTIGLSNSGLGGYLQTAGISRGADGTWMILGQPIDPSRTYRVAISDFLLTGGEKNLEFLTRQNPEIGKITEGGDVRLAVIDEMKREWPK